MFFFRIDSISIERDLSMKFKGIFASLSRLIQGCWSDSVAVYLYEGIGFNNLVNKERESLEKWSGNSIIPLLLRFLYSSTVIPL